MILKDYAKASLQYFTGLALAFFTELEVREIFDGAIGEAKAHRASALDNGIHIDSETLRDLMPESVRHDS